MSRILVKKFRRLSHKAVCLNGSLKQLQVTNLQGTGSLLWQTKIRHDGTELIILDQRLSKIHGYTHT
jgi:hypothetical protein